jgi:hypothetical protein
MALHLILFLHLRRRTGPAGVLLAFIAVDLVLVPFTLARPHLLAWPVLAGWTAMLLRARDERRPPPIYLALLMIVWTNLHGSFPLGLAVAAAIGLDAVIESRWNRQILTGWLAFGLAGTAAALLNANGISGILHPFEVAGLDTLTLIQEWKPSSPASTPWFFAVLVAALGAMVAKRVRPPIGELVLLLLLLALALYCGTRVGW